MIVGERHESIETKNKRHIQEMENDITEWNNELNYALDEQNEEYGDYCRTMISICNNTLSQLEEDCKKFYA